MGPEGESASAITGLAPEHVLVVMSSEAWDAYGVPGSPYFVYIDGATGSIVGEGHRARLVTSGFAHDERQ